MDKLKVIFLYLLFSIIITLSWQSYEIATVGEIQPNTFDTVITIILALSLTINVVLIQDVEKIIKYVKKERLHEK